ncbi:fructosamine kinase family protein [Kocuria rhizophila]|nr:fructosamine kinase family protein [Kocuria rhizophila]
MVDASGGDWLIDPSSFYRHREYDLAMMQLFGGFGRECSPRTTRRPPPADGWRSRSWYRCLRSASAAAGASVMSAAPSRVSAPSRAGPVALDMAPPYSMMLTTV